MKKNSRIILICAVVAIVGIIILVLVNKKEEAYRNIQITQFDGITYVEREGKGRIDTFENMLLQNADMVTTEVDSHLFMKLDSEKYLAMEPETIIRLEATGSEETEDTKTRIVLEQGAVVNQIDAPLKQQESYEVRTPSATMAVRGTIFRVIAQENENDGAYTTLMVDKGQVEVYREDAPEAGNIIVEAGYEVVVKETDTDFSKIEPYLIGSQMEEDESEDNYIQIPYQLGDLKFAGFSNSADFGQKIVEKYGLTLMENWTYPRHGEPGEIEVDEPLPGKIRTLLCYDTTESGAYMSWNIQEFRSDENRYVLLMHGNSVADNDYYSCSIEIGADEAAVKEMFAIDQILEKVGEVTPFYCNWSDEPYQLHVDQRNDEELGSCTCYYIWKADGSREGVEIIVAEGRLWSLGEALAADR